MKTNINVVNHDPLKGHTLQENIENALGFRVSSSGANMAITVNNNEHWIEADDAIALRDIVSDLVVTSYKQVLNDLNQELFYSTVQPDGQFIKDIIMAKLKDIDTTAQ